MTGPGCKLTAIANSQVGITFLRIGPRFASASVLAACAGARGQSFPAFSRFTTAFTAARPGSGWSRQARLRAFKSQNGNCFYCQLPMLPTAQEGPRALLCTAEHLLARCDGGRNSPKNIVAACRHCNSKRHARSKALPPELFKDYVQRRMAAGRWHHADVRKVAHDVAARRHLSDHQSLR